MRSEPIVERHVLLGEVPHVRFAEQDGERSVVSIEPEVVIGAKFGRYVIKSMLGEGGMSAVYLAADPLAGREVALKVVPRRYVSEELYSRRFYQEARLTAQFRHPNITALYDVGEQDGLPYMATEYVEGTDLGRLASSADRPALLVLLRIMSAIAGAESSEGF
jgi:serine/threonine protein kinase